MFEIVVLRESAEPLVIAIRDLATIGVRSGALTVKYRPTGVEIRIVEPHASETAWAKLIKAFQSHGWGFHTYFDNGPDAPRTAMVFNHPTTLARVR